MAADLDDSTGREKDQQWPLFQADDDHDALARRDGHG